MSFAFRLLFPRIVFLKCLPETPRVCRTRSFEDSAFSPCRAEDMAGPQRFVAPAAFSLCKLESPFQLQNPLKSRVQLKNALQDAAHSLGSLLLSI